MPDEEKQYSLKVIKDYFGVRPGETIKDFSRELYDLSEEEKIQLTKGIENGSLNY